MARLAGLEGCCCSPLQQERMGSSLCLACSLCRPGRTLSRATWLGTVCRRAPVREAVGRSSFCCLSPGLCLPLLILPAKCMGLLEIQWSGQSHRRLPSEHFGSGELDLPALLSIKRAFVASNGSNVRALWVCARGVGGMPDARWWCVLRFAQRWSYCELNASKWWRKPTED